MRNPAEYTTGFGFFLCKKGGPGGFALSNKVGFDCDPIGDVSYFFCDQNRRVLRGDGGSLSGPHLLRLAGPAKDLMIAIKKLISDLREL
jgi:hypothetical protein